jgi:2-methylisocitrate lyase-like PEP mutase family enzyme
MQNQSLAAKAETLLRLHHQDQPLVLCNVWDAASARIVEAAGYPALATTSAGVANSLGYPDGEAVPMSEMLDAVRRITRSVQVPVTADLEAGYGDVAKATLAALDAGAVGLNFEDYTHDALVPIEKQVEAIRIIRKTGESRGIHIVINARTDVYLQQVGAPETRFEATVRRLHAFHEAGADCGFVPYVVSQELITRLVQAVSLPINILVTAGCPDISWLAEAGVKRVSLGSGPMHACMGLTKQIAEAVNRDGIYDSFLGVGLPGAEANALFVRS